MSEPVVQVSNLVKRYGDLEAVRGIDFAVQQGETFGFLGPNGAGKSTTIKILCTLADPTSGTARVAGYDVQQQRDTVRRNIGLVFQDTTLDTYLTGLLHAPRVLFRRRAFRAAAVCRADSLDHVRQRGPAVARRRFHVIHCRRA